MLGRLCPRRLGSLVQANARRLSLSLSLALIILCAAINSGKLDVELSSWIQRTTRVEKELQAIESAIGNSVGSNNLLILQIPKQRQTSESDIGLLSSQFKKLVNNKHDEDEGENNINNVLSVESMMIHLEALAIATHTTIDLYDVSWSLKDICFAPTPPDYEGLLVNQMLDHLMPCIIKTPLDCFWEGARLLGPEQDVRLSSIGPKLKWTSLNPISMIELQHQAHPHASFPYETLLNWMRRVGINDGYLRKPCLDPSDPNCPISAPNKLTGEPPNIAQHLTGGCRGLATKQMHWKEEELVGGVLKNKSGYIVGAEALQSTVLLMGDRDVYEYWRKTSKVQDINNWSIDKAKLVLDSWQARFKEELAQFTRSTMTSNMFKIHALSPKSMSEPIDTKTVLDLNNFKLTAIFMTLFTCIAFPRFTKASTDNAAKKTKFPGLNRTRTKDNEDLEEIDRIKITILALATSAIVILTFVASLGSSSFFNLPFNMATTQILPTLALFYGFRQALMIANTYAKLYKHTRADELTRECLLELMPIIVLECATFVIPLIVAAAFPVQATRAFTLQAITHILLATLISMMFIPSLLTIFLVKAQHKHRELFEVVYDSDRPKSSSPGVLSIPSKKNLKINQKPPRPSLEEQIFSRLQDDLKNIKSESHSRATDINFSAQFGPDGLRTSISLRTDGSGLASNFVARDRSSFTSNRAEPTFDLPDVVLRPETLIDNLNKGQEDSSSSSKLDMPQEEGQQQTHQMEGESSHRQNGFIEFLAENRFIQLLIVLIKIIIIVYLFSCAPKVKFGLQLRDIIIRGTEDYDSYMIREKYFPVYNIFAITKNGLDYPSNQKLLHELYERISNVDGVIRDEYESDQKFWLSYFRNWLMELQDSFDQERNRSLISKDGWDDKISDSAKLAYKLLAQTGKIDNPIDKNLIESNRLVDKSGIINPKAFYYYLTAWVMNDAFTYSTSEADFKPEPKTWNENPNDLRIERARPLSYAQIPFLMNLPEDQDNMRSISEIRAISQRFELLDLPNFPTGIPFIFWDQFINLDYLFFTAIIMIVAVLFLLFGLAFGNFVIATILVLPMMTTVLEIYSLLDYFSMPFNSIVGVMIISIMGIIAAQTIQMTTYYQYSDGDLTYRVCVSMKQSFKTVIIGLILLALTTIIFYNSKIDFMTKYSYILVYLLLTSTFNSLLLTPALLGLLGSDHIIDDNNAEAASSPVKSLCRSPIRNPNFLKRKVTKRLMSNKHHHQGGKRRGYPRVQSEISLSTISEEPQSEVRAHDLKLNFSIRC